MRLRERPRPTSTTPTCTRSTARPPRCCTTVPATSCCWPTAQDARWSTPRAYGVPLPSVDVPVLRQGQGRYVLSMQYFGERQGGILTRQNIPPDITATIYDSSARIICPDDAQDFRTLLRAQFKAGRLAQTVERALQATGLPSHLLVIEITEQHQLADSEQTRAAMADLRALGVLVAIDDFGTGYSSLSYISRLRPDELKLDKSLVENVDADAERAGVVVAALAMARSLKLEVVAEGVETEAEKGFLRAHGCDMAQGFLYQRAMPAGEFENCRRDAVAFEIHTPNLWPVIPAKAG